MFHTSLNSKNFSFNSLLADFFKLPKNLPVCKAGFSAAKGKESSRVDEKKGEKKDRRRKKKKGKALEKLKVLLPCCEAMYEK